MRIATASEADAADGDGGGSRFAAQTPVRRLKGRPSGAHLLMLIAGALAFVLVLVVLRDRAAMATVAVAASDLGPGQLLENGSVDFVELPAAVSELHGVMTPASLDAGRPRWVATAVPRGALLRSSDLTTVSPRSRRVMSIAVDGAQAAGGAVAAGDVIDVVVVRDGEAGFAATGVTVDSVDGEAGSGRSSVTLSVVVAPGQDLRLAEALSGGEVHVVRAADG